ncbi:MAG: hypothetical protein AB7O26_09010 [Planctomycetaceae bacterium]
MTAEGSRDQFRLGFLTAIETSDRGYVGGLLVTNHFGRPLEFQCTAPVKPNRTQEILYGPTLVPFVLGELIGRTLVEKVGVKPHLVLTERAELLDVRAHVSLPVACVESNEVARQELNLAEKLQTSVNTSADTEPAAAPENAIAVAETPEAETESGPVTISAASLENGSISFGRQMLRFHSAHPGDRGIVQNSARLIPEDADLREPFERVREALQETVRLGAIK